MPGGPPPGGPAQVQAYNQLKQVTGSGRGAPGQAMSAYAQQYGTGFDPRGTIGGSTQKFAQGLPQAGQRPPMPQGMPPPGAPPPGGPPQQTWANRQAPQQAPMAMPPPKAQAPQQQRQMALSQALRGKRGY